VAVAHALHTTRRVRRGERRIGRLGRLCLVAALAALDSGRRAEIHYREATCACCGLFGGFLALSLARVGTRPAATATAARGRSLLVLIVLIVRLASFDRSILGQRLDLRLQQRRLRWRALLDHDWLAYERRICRAQPCQQALQRFFF
jgi:hypothetical protein